MTDIFEEIEGFNRDLVGVKRDQIGLLNPDEADWLVEVMREEAGELQEAMGLTETTESIVAQADALMDIIYFAVGGFTRLGIPAEKVAQIFQIVHSANMAKKAGKKEAREKSIDLDAVKPEGWVAPEEQIKELLFGFGGQS